jgi:hypothetical protein
MNNEVFVDADSTGTFDEKKETLKGLDAKKKG